MTLERRHEGGRDTARRLRAEFDGSFASAPAQRQQAAHEFVLVQCGGRACGLQVQDLQGLERVGSIVAVPSSAAALVGLANLRGTVVPVFSIATLLGLAVPDETREDDDLVALVDVLSAGGKAEREGEIIALTFERVLKFVRVATAHVFCHPADATGLKQPHSFVLQEIAAAGGVAEDRVYDVLDLKKLLRHVFGAGKKSEVEMGIADG